MPAIKVKETKVITTSHEVALTKVMLLALIRQGTPIPANANVFVSVPGGGDWSNTDLDIDDDIVIHVHWKTARTEGMT